MSGALTLPFVGGADAVDPAAIVYIENHLHRATLYLRDGSERHIYTKMDELEKVLAAHGFLRIHQSFLVNREDVRDLRNYRLYLHDGTELSVARARYRAVKETLRGGEQAWISPPHGLSPGDAESKSNPMVTK